MSFTGGEFAPKICTLPPEVLAHIMILSKSQGTSDPSVQMILFSHVCRHWRHAALSFPHLWSHIVAADGHFNTKRIQTSLERSKSTLLDVEVDLRAALQQTDIVMFRLYSVLFDLLRQTSRFRRLVVRSLRDALSHGLLDTPAPYLQELTLIKESETMHDVRPISIPHPLFGGEMPSLRALSTVGFAPPEGSLTFSGLTYLRIADGVSDRVKPILPQILNILGCCALTLETLELSNCLGHNDMHHPGDSLTVLAKLKHLEVMKIGYAAVAKLTDRLHLPSDSQINLLNIGFDSPVSGKFFFESVLPNDVFIPHCPTAHPGRDLTLVSNRCLQESVVMKMYDRSMHESGTPWHHYEPPVKGLRLNLSLDWFFVHIFPDTLVRGIFQDGPPLSDIHTLRVQGTNYPSDASFWAGLLRGVTNVHRLSIGSELEATHVSCILQSLLPSQSDVSQDDRPAALPLPQLSHLHISAKCIMETDKDFVRRVLDERERAGAKLETVTIAGGVSPRTDLRAYAERIGASVVDDEKCEDGLG